MRKKGKGYVDLPILLSKLNINSSKELTSNVKQLVKITRKEQVKILDDKIKTNERQYDLDRMNAEISAYSSGDLPKYEYLNKKDLGYKPDTVEKVKFEYSPLGKVFTDGLDKSNKKVGILQILKNIKDNLNINDDDDNDDGDNGNRKVGIFQIIKDIKDKGIKISNDDEVIREIRKHIQNLRKEGVRVNNFDEISKEIRDHIQNLKYEGIDVNINNNQVNDLVKKIFKGISKRDSISEDSDSEDVTPKNLNMKKFLLIYKEPITTFYKDSGIKYDIDTKKINNSLIKYNNKKITGDNFLRIYNVFINDFDKFSNAIKKKHSSFRGPNQKELLNYGNELKKIIEKSFNPSGSGLKILNNQQMLNRLPILLAQIQEGNHSKSLKNETRQILYSL